MPKESDIENVLKQNWDGPERWSDVCDGCGHTRAEHHDAPAYARPVGGGECHKMEIPPEWRAAAKLSGVYSADAANKAKVNCDCDRWRRG